MQSFDRAYATLAEVRRTLQASDPSVLSRDAFRRITATTLKATAYVSASAAYERFLVDFSGDVRLEVVGRAAPTDAMHTALTALVLPGRFAAARDHTRMGFKERVELLGCTSTVGDWSATATFHDGKTVDAASFESVWQVLRLDGSPFPGAAHRFTLNQVKERRNRVCHGEASLEEEGRRVVLSDVLKDLERLVEQLEHLDVATDDWLMSRGWSP